MPPLVLFDDGLGQLAPLADLRPSFDIATGALPTRQRLAMALQTKIAALFVRSELLDLTRSRQPATPVNELPSGEEPFLLFNGRCPLPGREVMHLQPGQSLVEDQTGDVVACVLDRAAAAAFLASPDPGRAGKAVTTIPFPALLSRPWHTRTVRDVCIDADLALMSAHAPNGQDLAARPDLITFGAYPLLAAPTARVYPGAVFDREHGPIVIDDHAIVRPGATIIGPVYIGPHVTVLDRALIKQHTAVGPYCKLSGEVGGTIFQGYANKAHDGHLGDSWVGEWVNLGAGTTNSNLLNTYAEVTARATPGARMERTGHQFLGCVLGDHVKTAIGTRIMTGAVIHTGAMLAQTAPVSGCVSAFAWCTDGAAAAGAVGAARPQRYRLDKFLEVAKAAMERRKVPLSDAYARRLSALHGASSC